MCILCRSTKWLWIAGSHLYTCGLCILFLAHVSCVVKLIIQCVAVQYLGASVLWSFRLHCDIVLQTRYKLMSRMGLEDACVAVALKGQVVSF